MGDKIHITILILLLLSIIIVNKININQRPSRAEVITIYKELIKADTLTIFDKKNVGRLERYILIQGLVLTGELKPEALYPEIQWFIDRNEQRIEALNVNLED